METCIYLFDTGRKLTYQKQEHVISAGLGGKCKLPKGYVSDQANELFSKFELKYLRYSPLAIARMHYGPGKRGSLNLNSIEIPDVFSLLPVSKDDSENYICPLGFIFQGKTYILPQVIAVFDSNQSHFDVIYLRAEYSAPGNLSQEIFLSNLHDFLLSTNRNYKLIDVPYNTNRLFICIGCYKKSWYICNTLPNQDIEYWARKITNKRPLSQIPLEYFGDSTKPSTFRYRRSIELKNLVPTFIHAKNCFNSLALFKGYQFAQQKIFDHFRHCIINNSNWDTVLMPSYKLTHDMALWIRQHICNHEHIVVIYAENTEIMAFSVLYGKEYALFKVGTEYEGKPFSYAVICDFEKAKETWFDSGSLI